jgi:hypothetical protein
MDSLKPGFAHETTRRLAVELTEALVNESSLNEYLEKTLPLVGRLFGLSKISLVDYREQTDHFDLLHFEGYPPDSVSKLTRSFDSMELKKALNQRGPLWSSQQPSYLLIPFYFSDILEAVIVMEGGQQFALSDEQVETTKLIARFFGLLMSSTRLKVNRTQVFDLNDLQRARQIQLSFLPQACPQNESWEIFGYNSSSALVGGDYFDYFYSGGDTVQCILADACGHGLAAALIMSNFRGLLTTEVRRNHDLDQLFDILNRSVHFEEDVIQYLTSIFFDFREADHRFRYLNAGHYDPIIVSREGEVRSLSGGGPPLGMFRGSCYQPGETELLQGDLVALFTDGLVDIENAAGEYFGTEGILKVDAIRVPCLQVSV